MRKKRIFLVSITSFFAVMLLWIYGLPAAQTNTFTRKELKEESVRINRERSMTVKIPKGVTPKIKYERREELKVRAKKVLKHFQGREPDTPETAKAYGEVFLEAGRGPESVPYFIQYLHSVEGGRKAYPLDSKKSPSLKFPEPPSYKKKQTKKDREKFRKDLEKVRKNLDKLSENYESFGIALTLFYDFQKEFRQAFRKL